MLWERLVKPSDTSNKKLMKISLGYEGGKYVVWYVFPSYYEHSLFVVKNIENDSLIATLDYTISKEISHLDAGLAEYSSNISLSTNYLFYYGNYFGYGQAKVRISGGFLDIFKISTDTIYPILIGQKNYGSCAPFFFNHFLKKLVITGVYAWSQGPFNGRYTEGITNTFELYDVENKSKIDLMHHIPSGKAYDIGVFVLSDDGKYLWVTYENKISVIQLNGNIKLREVPYSDTNSQILPCRKRDIILLTRWNKIYIMDSKLLKPLDTLSIGVEKNILSLKFSPTKDTLYFYNGKELYRFAPKLRTPFGAFFYTNTLDAIVGDTIKFYNVCSGNPESYHWEFGDGVVSNEPNPVHIYQTHGIFKPKLK